MHVYVVCIHVYACFACLGVHAHVCAYEDPQFMLGIILRDFHIVHGCRISQPNPELTGTAMALGIPSLPSTPEMTGRSRLPPGTYMSSGDLISGLKT